MHGWLALSPSDKNQYLQALSDATGRTPFVLEKDIWVVDVLRAVFESHFAQHLAFKGGTSLSKGFKIIDRFSEDVDIAWDMSHLLDIQPKYDSNTFMGRYGVKADAKIEEIVLTSIGPYLEIIYSECEIEIERKTVFLNYPSVTADVGLKKAAVRIEFDARSDAAPTESRAITPYASQLSGFILWDDFEVPCYPPEYTFWEKLCAIYRYTTLRNLEWNLARHWCDLVDIHNQISSSRIFNVEVAKKVISESSARRQGNVNPGEMLKTGISLRYDEESNSEELLRFLQETNNQGYFLEPRDVRGTLEMLKILESSLNNFLQTLDHYSS